MSVPRWLLSWCFLAIILLGACGNDVEKTTDTPTQDPHSKQSVSDNIPLGKLPADASPTHYNLHLTIDPDIDTFSG
ncbi:MAG: hypothetical protein KUG75_09375, partial [Pseudomonadales bacterium]|nr:hypothetical protein [Pseudomonadales bacterium]